MTAVYRMVRSAPDAPSPPLTVAGQYALLPSLSGLGDLGDLGVSEGRIRRKTRRLKRKVEKGRLSGKKLSRRAARLAVLLAKRAGKKVRRLGFGKVRAIVDHKSALSVLRASGLSSEDAAKYYREALKSLGVKVKGQKRKKAAKRGVRVSSFVPSALSQSAQSSDDYADDGYDDDAELDDDFEGEDDDLDDFDDDEMAGPDVDDESSLMDKAKEYAPYALLALGLFVVARKLK